MPRKAPIQINTLSVTFDLRIKPQQLYDFRGAMIALAGMDRDLFHNREITNGQWGKPMNRYPLIQYRVNEGRAAIWAMNEGIEALRSVMDRDGIPRFEMYGTETPLRIFEQREQQGFAPKISREQQLYRLRHYIPLNEDKYAAYTTAQNYNERISLLEQLILNELVLYTYAAQWPLGSKQKIKVRLYDILHQSDAKYRTKEDGGKDIEKHYKSYDLLFHTNALLPEGIALGRHKSLGYGVMQLCTM